MPHPARIFITGSSDGLGLLAAKQLIAEGHQVVLHARNDARAEQARAAAPGAAGLLVADLADRTQVVDLAHQANALAATPFDAVIHNAGIYEAPAAQLFAVNTLAPYLLTALMNRPKRLVYLSTALYSGGRARLEDMETATRYSDSKFHIMLLTMAVARRWPDVYANAINPGWVPTKMGGPKAPDDLATGYATQCRLATSDDADVLVTGRYFSQGKLTRCLPTVEDAALQDAFIAKMEEISGVAFG